MTETIFSKIISKELPAEIVFEDESVMAFLDKSPINLGHTLVIPKTFYRNIFDMPAKEFGLLMTRVHTIALAVKEASGADGINISMNNESAAGQVIFHAHVHIIPRFENDGYTHWKAKQSFSEEETLSIKTKISEILN
ncbi:MAG: HIT family protein [Candidatus Paceibacterota bacterium]